MVAFMMGVAVGLGMAVLVHIYHVKLKAELTAETAKIEAELKAKLAAAEAKL